MLRSRKSFMGARRVIAPPLNLHANTLDYISRLQAVGAHLPAYDSANDYLIRELTDLGGAYWDTMNTFTTLCAKGFSGLMVPLRDGMTIGTATDFVSGDLDPASGLKGDGIGKYIDSNIRTDAHTNANFQLGLWASEIPVGSDTTLIGEGEPVGGYWTGNQIHAGANLHFRHAGREWLPSVVAGNFPGYFGMRTTHSGSVAGRYGEISGSSSGSHPSVLNARNWLVFARGYPGSISNVTSALIPFYHIGPNAHDVLGVQSMEVVNNIVKEFMLRVLELGPPVYVSNDFSQYPLGSQPGDWTIAGTSATWNTVALDTPSGKGLRLITSGQGQTLSIRWNDVPILSYTSETLMRVKSDTTGGINREVATACLRGQGSGEQGILGGIGMVDSVQSLMISKRGIDPERTILASVPFTWVGEWVWFRFRATNTGFQLKGWTGAYADEPAGWNLEATDETYGAGGSYVTCDNENRAFVDFYSNATGTGHAPGPAAPTEPILLSTGTPILMSDGRELLKTI